MSEHITTPLSTPTTPPEVSHVKRVNALKRRSEAVRLRKVTRISQGWEQIIARKNKAFRPGKHEKATGTVFEFMKLVGHAVNHEVKKLRQRRGAANFAIELAAHNGTPPSPQLPKRQLSKPWRRMYNRNTK